MLLQILDIPLYFYFIKSVKTKTETETKTELLNRNKYRN